MSVSFLHKYLDETRPGWAVAIARELDMVERTLETTICSDVPTAYDLSIGLLSAGGKRIRPALVVLSALASGEYDSQRMLGVAAAAELVHMASLVHDDVVDETRERRGARTANENWGNKISVLGGDYLLSKAFQLLVANGGPDVLRVLSATAVRMTESEMLQASAEGDLALWEANYWRIIRDKTAHFLGACCECGAYIGGADPRTRDLLREYGVQLGLAFQITDDVLDIAGDPAVTGKATGSDLTQGKYTLPVLLALRNSGDAASLRAMLMSGKLTRDEAELVAAKVIECGAVDDARGVAVECVDKAREQLREVAASDFTRALDALAGFVIGREA